MRTNPIRDKSKAFAVRIILLKRELQSKKEFEIANQVVRSGTAIGAMVEEAHGANSNKDFVYKMTLSYKEAKETKYWLDILKKSSTITDKNYQSLNQEITEILKILVSILKTMKAKTTKNPP